MFDLRKKLKSENNKAEAVIKLMMNGSYGKSLLKDDG